MSLLRLNPNILLYEDDVNPLLTNHPPCPISHNWPQEDFSVELYSGISHIKRLNPAKGCKGGGKRSSITNFTKASRKRLLQRMAACRNMDAGYFGTFTFPGHFTYDAHEVKRILSAFRKRILRRFPEIRAIWRMEIKTRLSGESEGENVPHFHLLFFGIAYGHERQLTLILGQMWDELANHNDRDVPFLRSEVTQIRSRSHAVYYASKYAAKIDDGLDDGFGRHWGFFGEWDESMSCKFRITGTEMIHLKRLIRSWLKSKGRHSVARLFAGIRQDFGIAIFGLGDNDDWTGATVTIISLIANAQKIALHI